MGDDNILKIDCTALNIQKVIKLYTLIGELRST